MPRLCRGFFARIACNKFDLNRAALQARRKAEACERSGKVEGTFGNTKRLVIVHALQRLLKSVGAKVDQALERTMDVSYRYERKAEEQRERKDL